MTETKPKRRWFRFSLRTLFVLVTAIAVFIGWNLWQVRQRQEYFRLFSVDDENVEGLISLRVVGEEPKLSFVWILLGAKPQEKINLSREKYSDDDIRRIESLFPEADIFIADHHSYGWPPDRWGAR